MSFAIWEFAIKGEPRTKKNSSMIIRNSGRPKVMPSKQFREYERVALWQLLSEARIGEPISCSCNVKCVYYMKSKRRVDLVNLQEGTLDILVKARIIEDDNSQIVATMDGSCVRYDKDDPRVEIFITEAE